MQPLITHVVPTLAPYGAERVVLELAARLPQHGFRTRVLVLFEDGALRDAFRARDIRWAHVGPVAPGPRLFARAALLHRLAKRLYAEPERMPSIVHTHLFGADFWTSLARYTHMGRVRPSAYVSTAHNVDQDDSSVRRLARRWANRRMHRVVAISEEVERYVKDDLGVAEKRIVRIPNGVDFTHLPRRGAHPFAETPQLLMVGRLVPQKGHATVLRALQHVSAPWKLSLVGEGPLRRTLKELSEELGLASRVRFLGERKDVPGLLARTDLFLFPSQWEGMGLAALEAIAAGVPTLTSDLPVMHPFTQKDMRVPVEDIHAWTKSIQAILTHPTPTLAAAPAHADDIRTRYAVERMVQAYAALYTQLL